MKDDRYIDYNKRFTKENTPMYNVKTSEVIMPNGERRELPVWKPKECFAISDAYPNYLIGNMGTIYNINERCIERHRSISSKNELVFHQHNEDNSHRSYKAISKAVMDAHAPTDSSYPMAVNNSSRWRTDTIYNPYGRSTLSWTSMTNIHHATIARMQAEGGPNQYYHTYTNEDIMKICNMVNAHKSNADIAKEFGVDVAKVIYIIKKLKEGKYRRPVMDEVGQLESRMNKLTADSVHELCKLIAAGLKPEDIKKEMERQGYTISDTSIRKIKTKSPDYKRWWHIVDQYDFSNAYSKSVVYSDEELHTICKMASSGYSVADISKFVNIDETLVRNIVGKMRRKEYRNDITSQYPDIPYINNPLNEEAIRKVCELVCQGKKYQEIRNILEEDGYQLSKTSFYALIRKDKRMAKWWSIVDEYDMESFNPYRQSKFIYTDEVVEDVCKKIKSGHYTTRDIYTSLGLEDKGILFNAFRSLCDRLKINKSVQFKHISEKYFN